MKKFIFGLVTALVLGTLVNATLGYIKFGGLTGKPIDKDVKNCRDLIPGATSFGKLSVTILGNGKPVENLEVDVSSKPGPNRCMEKTNAEGVAIFSDVPVGKMVIYFNNAGFPKEFGSAPVVSVEIVSGQVLKKTIELKRQ